MRKRDQLKKEALEATTFRGHKMGKFQNYSPNSAYATCTVCGMGGMGVMVTSKPAPNDIDVGGSAVAMTCEGGKANAA